MENPSADRLDPHHLLRLNTTYRLGSALNRLTVGGGVSTQSSLRTTPLPGKPLAGGGYDATPLKNGGYALVNVMARYAINDRLTATLNIDNLFDRTYYRQYGFYDGLIYGEPRRFTLGLRASF